MAGETRDSPESTGRKKLRMRSPSFRSARPTRSYSVNYYADLQRETSYDELSSFDQEPAERSGMSKVLEALTYGIVNSILTIPALYGYAAIIFKASAFQDDMSALAKLVLFSSVMHQIAFSLQSSLPFAIGQVQDAGLIFLSTMATAISSDCDKPENVIPTTLVTLAFSTALLGVAVLLVGKLQLATLVSYLPMPVVGGYLAFIGFFCLQAGVGLVIGEDISTLGDWRKCLNWNSVKFILPAVLGGLMLSVVARKAKSWLALPSCILAMPLGFYLVLLLSNTSLQESRELGWMNEVEESKPFWDVWEMYNFGRVEWDQVPKQFITWLSMTFVVSFSSCLDVVAIEMDMGKALDINHELSTVGLSNILSGLTGGFTGSYIFSQTIFTYRTNTNSRLVGLVVIISEFGIFLAPFNIMSYIPKFFFAATLIFIAFDLCAEWLVHVYHKVSLKEYLVLLGTFLVILGTGDLIIGIAAGCGFAVLNFIIAYSSVSHVEERFKKSSYILRDFERRKVLLQWADDDIAIVALHGFLFFGSSVQIVNKAKILVEGETPIAYSSSNGSGLFSRARRMFGGSSTAIATTTTPLMHDAERNGTSYSSVDASGEKKPKGSGARYLILDFSRVTGMDATAISTGLMRVKQLAVTNPGLRMVFTSLRPEFESLLRANRVITDDDEDLVRIRVFNDLMDGLGWAENKILRTRGEHKKFDHIFSPRIPDIPFAFAQDGSMKVISSINSVPEAKESLENVFRHFFRLDIDEIGELCGYFGLMRVQPGRLIFDVGENADMLYVVMAGQLTSLLPKEKGVKIRTLYPDKTCYHGSSALKENCVILHKAVYGSFVGELHFTLDEERTFGCMATKESALFFMSRSSWKVLCKEKPKLALALSQMLTKNLSLVMTGMYEHNL